jgi:predicted dehydrogenase
MLVGIIGQGSIGRRHVQNIQELGHTVITCDANGSGDCTTLDELYSNPINAVVVCTAPVFHYEHALSAIERGLPCFCEKPLAMTWSQAEDLLWRNAAHATLACGYQLAASPSVKRFQRDWKVLHVWDKQDMNTWPVCTYQRDILLEFSHEIALVLLWADSMPLDVLCEWSDVCSCIIWLTWADERKAKIELSGNFDGYSRGAWSDRGNWEFSRAENDQSYKREISAFLGGTPICSGAEAAHVMRIIEAAKESARDCKVVTL